MADIKYTFELFPPKSDDKLQPLVAVAKNLQRLQPSYMSVTYGAGGSTQSRSVSLLEALVQQNAATTAGHITCVGAKRGDIDALLRRYWDIGVHHLVALRGDPIGGIGTKYEPHPDGYAYASDLIAGAKSIADFSIAAACYPEVHPEASGLDDELANLKRKFDAGADYALSQFFFAPDVFLRFRDAAAGAGINQPITPGIMLQSNFQGLYRMATQCGASMSPQMAEALQNPPAERSERDKYILESAITMCDQLIAGGVERFHFYVMNRSAIVTPLCEYLQQQRSSEAS